MIGSLPDPARVMHIMAVPVLMPTLFGEKVRHFPVHFFVGLEMVIANTQIQCELLREPPIVLHIGGDVVLRIVENARRADRAIGHVVGHEVRNTAAGVGDAGLRVSDPL